MKLYVTRYVAVLAIAAAASLHLADAVLVQPYNYMLDDSALVGASGADSGSLSPYYNDQTGASESAADRDIVTILGDSLARLRLGRMLDGQAGAEEALSPEMAELMSGEQQLGSSLSGKQDPNEQSLSSSVANMLMNVAQAAAQAASDDAAAEQQQQQQQHTGSGGLQHAAQQQQSRAQPIVELDTSAPGASGAPSKADVKQSSQWFNPKETIPVLKISSMGK